MTKCPYCHKAFSNWKSVRAHVSKCDRNNQEYIITLEYGPISYTELASLTYREFKHKYPEVNTTTTKGIGKALTKKGITTWKSMGKEEVKASFVRFFQDTGKVPTSRDCYHTYYLPTDFNYKQLFGSFNAAVEYSGLEVSSNCGYGRLTKALDGKTYRSNLEAEFVNRYLYNKHKYTYEIKYPNNKNNRVCDFYLENLDIFIEIAGGLRPEVIKEKVEFCSNTNLTLKVVYPNQVFNCTGLEWLI